MIWCIQIERIVFQWIRSKRIEKNDRYQVQGKHLSRNQKRKKKQQRNTQIEKSAKAHKS